MATAMGAPNALRDPLFVDKVQDIVGLYMSPPDRAVVLCVDEKSQIQALDRIARQSGPQRCLSRSGNQKTTKNLSATISVIT